MTPARRDEDVIDLLLKQHEEIRALITDVKIADGRQKRHAFGELVRLVVVHECAEEQVVHPASRRLLGDAVIDERLREEDDAKTLLSELYDMGADDPHFATRFAALETAVLMHTRQEEQLEFPEMRRTADPAALRRLTGAVRTAEAVTPKRPHPQAGVHPLDNLLVGPPVALYDTIREALGRWRAEHR